MGLSDSFSFSSLLVAVAALFFALGATFIVSQNEDHRKSSRVSFSIAMAIFWFSSISLAINTLELTMIKRYIIATIAGGSLSAFVVWIFAQIGMVPVKSAIAEPSAPKNPEQNCTGNCSFNQSGGTIIQNFNQEPQRLMFDQKLGEALVMEMTPRKPMVLKGIGNSSKDQQVIQRYAQFFLEKGFVVELFTIGMSIPSPNEKIDLMKTDDKYILTIAPSVF